MNIADKIRILRLARGFTQEALDAQLVRSNPYTYKQYSIIYWENGTIIPTADDIQLLAKVLHVSFDVLLNDSIDLNNPNTLTAVLKNTDFNASCSQIFRYAILVNNLSFKFFLRSIICGILLIIVLVCAILWNLLKNDVCLAIAFLVGFVDFFLLFGAISDLIRALRGKVFSYAGELNQLNLIFEDKKKNNERTIVPTNKIIRMDLGKEQKHLYGDVDVFIEGYRQPVVLAQVMKPKELIKVFKQITAYRKNGRNITIY